MTKTELFPDMNPDFSAMKPEGVTIILDTLAGGFDVSRFEAEDGLVYVYSVSELREIGGGDQNDGLEKVKANIFSDKRTVVERFIDPKKPFQNLLGESRMDAHEETRFIFTVLTRRYLLPVHEKLWGVGLSQETQP